MRYFSTCLGASIFVLASCTNSSDQNITGLQDISYAPPEDSGLIAVRPYPNADDVCQVIGENALTYRYLDHTMTLIGCPVHEIGAIEERISEGAVQQDVIGRWLLLSALN